MAKCMKHIRYYYIVIKYELKRFFKHFTLKDFVFLLLIPIVIYFYTIDINKVFVILGIYYVSDLIIKIIGFIKDKRNKKKEVE